MRLQIVSPILLLWVIGTFSLPHYQGDNHHDIDHHDHDNEHDHDDEDVTTRRSDIDEVEIELGNGDEFADEKQIIDIKNQIDEFGTLKPFLLEPDLDTDEPESTSVNIIPTVYIKNQGQTGGIVSGLKLKSTDPYHVGNASCECGRGASKIVGGETAKINDLPWTALLYRYGFFGGRSAYCGGTLINNLYIATASHCVDGRGAKGIEVVLNEENTASSTESETHVFKVEKIIMHPGYNRRKIDNDIALLKLARPVQLSETGPIIPACIPINNENNFVGKDAIAAGWGANREGGSVSKTLQKVTVPVISNEACNNTRYKGKITENMLCAGDVMNGMRDACQGDSGGPLVSSIGERKMLIGVTSWGYGCARPNSPGVYARVSQYAEWILSQTSDAEWCGA